MEPKVHSANFSYTYTNFATPKFYWGNHKYKKAVEAQKITIPQVLKVELKDKELSFHILELSQAALNKAKFTSDKYNEGTYIDILSYSFKPLKKCDCKQMEDSLSATLAKICEFQVGTNRGFNLGLGLGIMDQNTSNSIIHSIIRNCGTRKQEFEGKKHKEGNKNIVEFNMKLCYDGDDRFNGIPYDVNDLSTLRCCNHGTRVGLGFVPIVGMFGLWNTRPDTVYRIPEAAESSFGADWSLRYEIKNFQDLEFQWSTEVRTVFASNDNDVHLTNACGDYLNWIKTVHKITHVFKINLDEQGVLSIEVVKRNLKVVSAMGYEKIKISKHLLHDRDHSTLENKTRLDITHISSRDQGKSLLKEDEAKLKIHIDV